DIVIVTMTEHDAARLQQRGDADFAGGWHMDRLLGALALAAWQTQSQGESFGFAVEGRAQVRRAPGRIKPAAEEDGQERIAARGKNVLGLGLLVDRLEIEPD